MVEPTGPGLGGGRGLSREGGGGAPGWGDSPLPRSFPGATTNRCTETLGLTCGSSADRDTGGHLDMGPWAPRGRGAPTTADEGWQGARPRPPRLPRAPQGSGPMSPPLPGAGEQRPRRTRADPRALAGCPGPRRAWRSAPQAGTRSARTAPVTLRKRQTWGDTDARGGRWHGLPGGEGRLSTSQHRRPAARVQHEPWNPAGPPAPPPASPPALARRGSPSRCWGLTHRRGTSGN